ncbi:hypothetical protein HZS55_09070 [Halosimplex rubrum]|uniref:Uncharacterized protein n=1 Tax=Halosimplex rubrum TaxID=869889 RepID=A0A7D5T639_9EURY|nr:hypothetical protein [Halosimplex rubrum]QLH77435.1 hypothetical protein HZS55_09070 [Halosimplex rubrum]
MADDVQPGDTIASTDEANAAALDGDLALRVQPPAPSATQYYFADEQCGWQFQKCGHSRSRSVSVEFVRERVESAIARNDRPGGASIRAVERDVVGRYAEGGA